ncbi:hypothetical protein [Halopiger goleimassiliensis]|uniref:hypothetical protein n=1 Tax=Halopiger goleimassiliensis TaxID=1293048 RepID=UPI0012B60360|nr:hypothetical protein [Halopiger goleimassiliensis]
MARGPPVRLRPSLADEEGEVPAGVVKAVEVREREPGSRTTPRSGNPIAVTTQ